MIGWMIVRKRRKKSVEFVDASNSESNGENSTQEFEDEFTYLACAAHNLQLAINDAFKSFINLV
jgi:hypothetical protein